MSSLSSVAATLRPESRQQIAIEALAKSKPSQQSMTKTACTTEPKSCADGEGA